MPRLARTPAEREQLHPMPGRRGRGAKDHPDLVREPVLLAGVAPAAGRDHVLPRVETPPAPRDHVVEVLGRRAAVLAARTVPSEDGAAVDRDPVVARHLDVAHQTDHRGLGQAEAFRPEEPLGGVHELRFGVEHQQHRPARRDDAEGLEGRVEHQRTSRLPRR